MEIKNIGSHGFYMISTNEKEFIDYSCMKWEVLNDTYQTVVDIEALLYLIKLYHLFSAMKNIK